MTLTDLGGIPSTPNAKGVPLYNLIVAFKKILVQEMENLPDVYAALAAGGRR